MPVNHCGNGVRPGTHCDVYITLTPPALGTQTGTLVFTDDASNSPQTVSLTGVGATTVPTATQVIASPTTFLAGQPVTLQATVTSLGGGVIPDGDQVAFLFRGGFLGYGVLQKGVATITTSGVYWEDDTQKLWARYQGDQSFYQSKGAAEVHVQRYFPSISIIPNPDPSIYHQGVTLTAKLSNGGAAPIGGHIFISGLCGIVEYNVQNNTTQVCPTVKKHVGTYGVRVWYGGDGYNEPGSASSTQVINPTSSTTSIASSKNPSSQGQSVKFSVIVRAPYAHPVPGSVTFTSGADVLGTVDLISSRGDIIVSSLPVGQNTVTATYNPPDGDFLGSSASLVQVVNSKN